MFFQETVLPRLSDFDRNGKLSYEALMQIVENAGNHHSDSVNDSVIQGSMTGLAWLLAEWRISILDRPTTGDPLTVTTWIRGKNPSSLVFRCFELTDAAGALLARAEAKLVLYDVARGRMARIDPDLFRNYGPEERAVFETELPRMRPRESYENRRDLALRRSDIDFNGHVHNTRYLELMLDALPRADYDRDDLTEMRIAYSRPVQEVETVQVRFSREAEGWAMAVCADDVLCTLLELK